MPDMTPVANQVQSPDVLKGYSQILGIKQQKQDLQRGAAALQQESQSAAQRKNIANYFQNYDWSNPDNLNPDGTTNIDKVMRDPSFAKAAGDQLPEALKSLYGVQNAQLQNKTALAGLNGTLRGQFLQMTGGLYNDPDVQAGNEDGWKKVNSAIEAFGATGGQDAQRIAGQFGTILNHVPKDKKGSLANTLQMWQQQGMSADQQASAMTNTPQFVQTAQGLQPVNTNARGTSPVGTPMGAPVPNAAPPGTFVDSQGRLLPFGPGGNVNPGRSQGPQTSQPSPTTTLRRPDGHAWTASDSAPPPNSPDSVVKAYGTAVQKAQQDVTTARESDAKYGTNMALADKIRDLTYDTKTGPGSEGWTKIKGYITTLGGGSEGVSNYQQLGAFLDRQAAEIQASMGLPNTNAGMASSQAIAGNTGYTPAAIRAKNDFLQALVEGQHQYRQGLDRVEGFTGQPNPQAVERFKAAWSANFDPRIYEGQQAFGRSKEDGTAFMSKLSKSEAAELKRKRDNLNKLINGELPNG